MGFCVQSYWTVWKVWSVLQFLCQPNGTCKCWQCRCWQFICRSTGHNAFGWHETCQTILEPWWSWTDAVPKHSRALLSWILEVRRLCWTSSAKPQHFQHVQHVQRNSVWRRFLRWSRGNSWGRLARLAVNSTTKGSQLDISIEAGGACLRQTERSLAGVCTKQHARSWGGVGGSWVNWRRHSARQRRAATKRTSFSHVSKDY